MTMTRTTLPLGLKQSNTKIPVPDYLVLREFAARRRMTLQQVMAKIVAPAAEAIRKGQDPLRR